MRPFESRPADWLSVSEALQRILEGVSPLPEEEVPLGEALGRVLAEGVQARATLPPWDSSAMDGYAVRSGDLEGASPSRPRCLEVVGEAWPEDKTPKRIGPGQACRIMTGAPLPLGADAVVRMEETDRETTSGRVRVQQEVGPGRDVRRKGEDMTEGEGVLGAGAPLGPGALAVLAAAGAHRVRVHQKPRVAILATGDELVEAGSYPLVSGGPALPETNNLTLAAAVVLAGGSPLPLGIARDRREEILQKTERAWGGEADVLLVTGGASVGEKDLVKRVLEAEMGLEVAFWRVRMRPGSPFGFGLLPRPGRPPLALFSLPGTPASVFVTFQVLCRPYLLRLAGHLRVHRPVIGARAGVTFHSPPDWTSFFRVVLRGSLLRPEALPTAPEKGGPLRTLAAAQGLAVVREGRERVEKGEEIPVMLLDDFTLGSAHPDYLDD